MKLITKNTDYAIRALLEMGPKQSEFISSRGISESADIPYQFLRKILQVLIKERIVESKEGGRGGFRLRKSPDKIKVADLIQIFQGDLQLSECMFRKKMCSHRATCVLRHSIMEIEHSVVDYFKGLTIAKLLKQTVTKRRRQ